MENRLAVSASTPDRTGTLPGIGPPNGLRIGNTVNMSGDLRISLSEETETADDISAAVRCERRQWIGFEHLPDHGEFTLGLGV
jgi:hypothetical protein